jgi:hypothetical protein
MKAGGRPLRTSSGDSMGVMRKFAITGSARDARVEFTETLASESEASVVDARFCTFQIEHSVSILSHVWTNSTLTPCC